MLIIFRVECKLLLSPVIPVNESCLTWANVLIHTGGSGEEQTDAASAVSNMLMQTKEPEQWQQNQAVYLRIFHVNKQKAYEDKCVIEK